MPYRVTLSNAADKAISRLPHELRARVTHRLEQLKLAPRGVGTIKLSGRAEYRVRVGDYRIIYAIRDDVLLVIVIDVDHRSDVYRR